MKILSFYTTFLMIILVFTFLPVLLHADQVLSTKNRTIYINAPDTIVHVKVEDEGEKTAMFGDGYSRVAVKGWLCGRNLTEETLKIVSRLNMATKCFSDGRLNLKGSTFQGLDDIKHAVEASREIIERAKKGYGDVLQMIDLAVYSLGKLEIDFKKAWTVSPMLESSDPDNYTSSYRIDNCYTESDIKKFIQVRVDAANALINAYENWLKKYKENLGIK